MNNLNGTICPETFLEKVPNVVHAGGSYELLGSCSYSKNSYE